MRKRYVRNGFTADELLVVIAIIAVLIGLAALPAAAESARGGRSNAAPSTQLGGLSAESRRFRGRQCPTRARRAQRLRCAAERSSAAIAPAHIRTADACSVTRCAPICSTSTVKRIGALLDRISVCCSNAPSIASLKRGKQDDDDADGARISRITAARRCSTHKVRRRESQSLRCCRWKRRGRELTPCALSSPAYVPTARTRAFVRTRR